LVRASGPTLDVTEILADQRNLVNKISPRHSEFDLWPLIGSAIQWAIQQQCNRNTTPFATPTKSFRVGTQGWYADLVRDHKPPLGMQLFVCFWQLTPVTTVSKQQQTAANDCWNTNCRLMIDAPFCVDAPTENHLNRRSAFLVSKLVSTKTHVRRAQQRSASVRSRP